MLHQSIHNPYQIRYDIHVHVPISFLFPWSVEGMSYTDILFTHAIRFYMYNYIK